jgi:IS30 family transposase
MESVAQIRVAWALRKQSIPVNAIAEEVGKDRSTIYRWLKGIRQYGIEGFIHHNKNAKKGRRQRKTHPYIEQRVLTIRREHHNCCGEKILYWLERDDVHLSRSTVYRILNKHLKLRTKGRRNKPRGPLPKAQGKREVIQMDTIDFGRVYAFTAIDIHTREGQVILRPGLTAQDGKEALSQFMAYFERCKTIQTDGGSEFEKEFAELAVTIAEHRIARPYNKNEQSFIERFNRTVRQECLGWEKYLPSQIPKLQRQVDSWLEYYH